MSRQQEQNEKRAIRLFDDIEITDEIRQKIDKLLRDVMGYNIHPDVIKSEPEKQIAWLINQDFQENQITVRIFDTDSSRKTPENFAREVLADIEDTGDLREALKQMVQDSLEDLLLRSPNAVGMECAKTLRKSVDTVASQFRYLDSEGKIAWLVGTSDQSEIDMKDQIHEQVQCYERARILLDDMTIDDDIDEAITGLVNQTITGDPDSVINRNLARARINNRDPINRIAWLVERDIPEDKIRNCLSKADINQDHETPGM